MKNLLTTAFIVAATSLGLFAGGINVVHYGPTDVLKFTVSAGEAAMDFTLAHGKKTGPFILPDKAATIKSSVEGIPSLDLPASETARIAILISAEEAYEWRLIETKPSEEKWAFRIINLSTVPANVLVGKKLLEVPAGKESAVPVKKKSDIRLKIPPTVNLSYKGNEPRGVVALVFRSEEQWKAVLLVDR